MPVLLDHALQVHLLELEVEEMRAILMILIMVSGAGIFASCEEAGEIGLGLVQSSAAVAEDTGEGETAVAYGLDQLEEDLRTMAETYDAIGSVFEENAANCQGAIVDLKALVNERKDAFRQSARRVFDNVVRLRDERPDEVMQAVDGIMESSFRAAGDIMLSCFERWEEECSREARMSLREMSLSERAER